MDNSCHFHGWATKNDLKCSDGRTIRKNAFKNNHGKLVPLVWNHRHDDPYNVLGHALLENRDEGVYAYCTFNDTENGQLAKTLVEHRDITQLSIYANQLKQQGGDVIHGMIREVSLVHSGANPGAFIECVVRHSDTGDLEMFDDELDISIGEDNIVLYHADTKDEEKEKQTMSEKPKTTEEEGKPEDTETLEEIFNTLSEKQKTAVNAVVALALEDNDTDDEEDNVQHSEEDNVQHSEGDDEIMKKNVFEPENQQENTLMHADIINNAIADAKRFGSLRESILQHAAINNITDIGELFPTAKDLNMPPEWIKEDETWVSKIMSAVHHTPFSRVRALFAKLDEEEARAQGYIKGNEKDKYMKLAILKRITQPTTIYIKMAMDRDDVVDITDFDVVAWQRAEMRKQLDKELARAFLLGDGRTPGTDGKIDENCIIPVLTDNDMYTIQYTVTDGKDFHNDFNSASDNDSEAKGVIRAAIKSRKQYKGSGKPSFFTTEDLLTELLLIEDQNGRRIYESEAALATAMRVKEIVTIPEMEKHEDVYGIIYNFNDYNTGADKGGSVNMFDDFDIDYNQLKYLMETRCSAANVKPKSAIVLKKEVAAG